MRRADRPVRPVPPRWLRDEDLPVTRLLPGVLAAASAFVALWPFTSVILPGGWSFAATAVIMLVGLVGLTLRTLLQHRARGLRESVVLLAQACTAVGALTAIAAGDTAVFGVVPTPATWTAFEGLSAAAWQEIALGSAPLPSTPALRLVLAAGFAVVAILLDQLMAHRLALLAWLLTAIVGSVPMIVTFGGANVVWFVLLGVLALILLRYAARRHPLAPTRASPAIVGGIGVAALATTVAIAPGLPVPTSWAGTGTGVSVNASLRLGDDLRRPTPVEVMTVAAKGDAPYLRLATLSRFDGRIWHPDEDPLQPQSEGFGAPDWAEEIPTEEKATSVRVLRMSSSWLPVPYPATRINGVSGDWQVMPSNRTVVSATEDANGSDYTVTALVVTPTLEQIRAIEAAPPIDELPPELPAVVGELAAEVTADAESDYDRLIALQDWFRSQFVYSLETPVEEGFDGTGAQAVATFLEQRSGYCVHFAGAFALMAQALDMQVRIVVGYLPGVETGQNRGNEKVFSVSSGRLHSWPEVLFPGIGWVPFEPTASLGVPTRFASGGTASGDPQGPSTPAPTATPGASTTSGPAAERDDAGGDSTATGPLRRLDPTPVVLGVAGMILVLLLPALARLVRTALRLRRAHRGDAVTAWTELRDTLVDLGLPVSDADSPRVRGAALVRERGADAEAVRLLVDAIEQASYANADAPPGDLAAPLARVTRALRRSVNARSRIIALLLPRSLFAARGADAPMLA